MVEFHQAQKQDGWTYARRSQVIPSGQKVTPLDRVGIYVPGGLASYPSSVPMKLCVPAHVAGVGEIVMVVPAPNGELNPLVLAAAYLAGVHRVFTIGGAQAVAAIGLWYRNHSSVIKSPVQETVLWLRQNVRYLVRSVST